MYKKKVRNAQKICLTCILTLFTLFFQACGSKKALQQLLQNQRISLQPSPLEMHGGNVKGSIRVAIPTKILQKYRKKNYQIQFYFSDYPHSEQESYLLELGTINFDKSQLKGDEQIQEIDFQFPFEATKSEGSVLAKGYFQSKRKKRNSEPYLLVGKGIVQTASLFREQETDTLLYLPIANSQSIPTLLVPFRKGSWEVEMDNTKQEILEILAEASQKIIIEASCSPEGEAAENLLLAQKRAEAIRKHLISKRKDVEVALHIHSPREIKQEINDLLATKNFTPAQVQEIKAIVQKSKTLETLEQNLQQKPYYSQIVTNLYPSLRYVRLSVADTAIQEPIRYYQLLIDTENNAAAHQNIGLWYWQAYNQKPDSLLLQKALYHLEIAAHIAPQAETFFNLMTIYRKLKNSTKSEFFKSQLLHTKPTNTFLQEFIYYEKGLQTARKAQSSKDKKYKQALDFFEKSGDSKHAQINKALVALLTHQYDKATGYLEKNKDDPLSYYLRAVAAARKGNEQESLYFLKNCFSKDKTLKYKAQKDLEFDILRENKDFLELIK